MNEILLFLLFESNNSKEVKKQLISFRKKSPIKPGLYFYKENKYRTHFLLAWNINPSFAKTYLPSIKFIIWDFLISRLVEDFNLNDFKNMSFIYPSTYLGSPLCPQVLPVFFPRSIDIYSFKTTDGKSFNEYYNLFQPLYLPQHNATYQVVADFYEKRMQSIITILDFISKEVSIDIDNIKPLLHQDLYHIELFGYLIGNDKVPKKTRTRLVLLNEKIFKHLQHLSVYEY